MTKHCRNYRICWQKKIDFSYSDPRGTLENKLNDLIPLFSRKKGFAFKKRRVNLADQTKQQSQRVSRTINDLSVWNKPLIDTWQYCSTSRTNQALRSLANAGFQNRGVCLQAFPSFPSPSPLFHFLALISFLARPKPVFLCSETKWKRFPVRRLSRLLFFHCRSFSLRIGDR